MFRWIRDQVAVRRFNKRSGEVDMEWESVEFSADNLSEVAGVDVVATDTPLVRVDDWSTPKYSLVDISRMTGLDVLDLRYYIRNHYLKATKIGRAYRVSHGDYVKFLNWARGNIRDGVF